MYKGIVVVTHQLGGGILGRHETECGYPTKEEARKHAKTLGSEIEYRYSAYANMDYHTKEMD